MSTQNLDCRGLPCPEPVVLTKKLIESQHPAALCVVVDNAAASENVTRLLTRSGYAVNMAKKGDKEWLVNASVDANSVCHVEDEAASSAKTLVLVTTETLGTGSDELGAKLMENFLASLPELGDALWRVVLLNGGVKLAATPGKALDSLKALEAEGVSILVCGTCLNFYNLLEAKSVGDTTNMMDVVTSLALAGKVIRP